MPEIMIQLSDNELQQMIQAQGCDSELNADECLTSLIERVVRDIEGELDANPIYSAHKGRMT